ncbi:MAG: hypothetical protein WAL56_18945 [Candidatus Sulfotelmatobacter sp.]
MKIPIIIALLFAGAAIGRAQTLPMGSITNPTSVSCTTNFYPHSACTSVTVLCPNVADIQATYSYVGPNGSKVGVVVLVNGAEDLTPGGTHYAGAYLDYDFAVEQIEFATAWEVTGETPNLKNAACRIATLLSYMQHATRAFPFGVHAGSAGAGAVGYALAWYGLTPQAVELTSGPSFSNIETGCEVPRPPHLLVVPTNGSSWTDLLDYNEVNTEANMQAWTGNPTCAGTEFTSHPSDAAWAAMSVVYTGAKNYFPNMAISGWVCNNEANNSASQTYEFFEQITSPWSLTAMSGCSGAEDVDFATTPQGVQGVVAIPADMQANLHF